MILYKQNVLLLAILILFQLNCRYKEEKYSSVVVWNESKTNYFTFEAHSLPPHDIGQRLIYKKNVVIKHRGYGLLGKWVNDDSILFVVAYTKNFTTKISDKINDMDVFIDIDTLKYCPDSIRQTLIRFADYHKGVDTLHTIN